MSTKSKRIIYSEADCHTLVDLIISNKNIVECKKTDATTWKQKVAAWGKIANIYNVSSLEPRTADQLRCKYDNLKKEVRKYEAHKRQSLYQTGGGMDEPDIKAFIKLLNAKIKSIISFSVKGLDPSEGDSDMVVDKVDMVQPNNNNNNILNQALDNNIILDDLAAATSKQNVVEQEIDISIKGKSENHMCQKEITAQIAKVPEIKSDWSDYTPKMLRSKKHKDLQVKRKSTGYPSEDDSHILKRKLMEEEAKRNEEYHTAMMKREEEMHSYKIKNINLQNEKLKLEIELLKNQLEK